MDELKSNTEELTSRLMKPDYTGVYLSKHDIVRIALGIDGAVTVGDRKMMFKDLFKLVDSPERLMELMDVMIGRIQEKIEGYETMIAEYPHAGFALKPLAAKANAMVRELETIKDEAYL